MSRISKADRQLQLQREEAGEHLYANRVRVYPKSVRSGAPIQMGGVDCPPQHLLPAALVALASWVNQPSQAVLLDVANERFYFFNLEFWPQDIYYLTGLLIIGAVALFMVTSMIGRVWCGYTCPQTVWTDLFMWVERMIEGDRNERMKRDAEPVTFDSAWRKGLKHTIWLGIAFWTGGAWIMYYVDAPTVTVDFWTGDASREVYFFTFLFAATTYLLAGWAREQVCTYMCPWPRFQSAMLDEQSVTVTYQGWRGEPRLRGKRHDGAAGGDCIDCGACVTACPTGIDIRDGIQLECINCGLCIDACNHVMDRTGQPQCADHLGHAGRTQAAKAEGRQTTLHLLRPRTVIYILGVAGGCRGDDGRTADPLDAWTVGVIALHRAPLFVRLPDGAVRNGYTVQRSSTKARARRCMC